MFWFILLFLCINPSGDLDFFAQSGDGDLRGRKRCSCGCLAGTILQRSSFFTSLYVMRNISRSNAGGAFVYRRRTNPERICGELKPDRHQSTMWAIPSPSRCGMCPMCSLILRRSSTRRRRGGIEMSSKASLWERIKKMSSIIFPLLFSSMVAHRRGQQRDGAARLWQKQKAHVVHGKKAGTK